MLALIRKDLVTSGQPILIVIGLWIVQWVTVLRLENVMTVGAFGTMVLTILIFGTDTSANGEAFTCSVATAALFALLTAAEYLVSINQGYDMFRVTPFSGLASNLNRLLAPVGHSMRAVLAVAALAMWMLGSMALSVNVFERREF